jgi:hypothetical protein
MTSYIIILTLFLIYVFGLVSIFGSINIYTRKDADGLNDDDDFIDYHIHVECREHAREFSDGYWVFPENRSKCIKFVTVEGTKELKEEMNNNLRIEGYLLDKVIGG